MAARTRSAGGRIDFIIPEAAGLRIAADLRENLTASGGFAFCTIPITSRIFLAGFLSVLISLRAAFFTAFVVGIAFVVVGVPVTLPRRHAVATVGVGATFIFVVFITPFTDASTVNNFTVVFGRMSRAAIFTTVAFGEETIPPTVEDRISNARSFVGMEDATSLQTFRIESKTSVVVDVAARITTALSHVGVHTFLFSADLRSVPRDPLAVRSNTAVFVVPDCALVVDTNGSVGVPFTFGIQDATNRVRTKAFGTSFFVASLGSGVPSAALGGGSTGRGVAVEHTSGGAADTGDDGVVDFGVAVESGVFDLAHFTGDTLASERDIKVQAVEVHAAICVGAVQMPRLVPFTIRHLIALNRISGLRAALFVDIERLAEHGIGVADTMENSLREVIEVGRSEVIKSRVGDEAHENELIFVVTSGEERVDGSTDVSAEDFDVGGRHETSLFLSVKNVIVLAGGNEKDDLLAVGIVLSRESENVLGGLKTIGELISDHINIVVCSQVVKILVEFTDVTRKAAVGGASDTVGAENGAGSVTVLDEVETETFNSTRLSS